LLVCWVTAAPVRVLDILVEDRAAVLDGQPIGDAGAYEKLSGRVRFSFDPANLANALVTDLALAPRGPSGGVEAEADFMVLRPVDAAKSSGVALLEVSNRGGKASLRYFNAACEGSEHRHRHGGLTPRPLTFQSSPTDPMLYELTTFFLSV
jgi:hypothetical protein